MTFRWPALAFSALLPLLCFAHGSSATSGKFAPQGVDISSVDKSIAAGDDFFNHVNAGWIAATAIPEGYWDYGQTSALIVKVDQQLASLLDESLKTRAARGTVERQVGDAYASFLDVAEIERRGVSKLQAELADIARLRSPAGIARWMAHPTSSSIIAINVYPAEGRWRTHLDQQNVGQPMLGLPNPDDYSRSDAPGVALREAYVDFVANILGEAGVADARLRAQRVLALETQIAACLWPLEKLRDRKANYHPMTVDALIDYAPGFPWRDFLAARNADGETSIVLGTDTAVQLQARLFGATPIEDWKSYLMFHWLQNQVDVLPERFQKASWDFYGARLSNARVQPSRQAIAARLVSSAMGMQLGKLYADRFVSEKTRSSAKEMITYLRKAFEERLTSATWMDEPTRMEAKSKLAGFRFKVAYPEMWRDFSGTRIERDDASGNLSRLRAADWANQLDRLKTGPREEVWYQTPQTVDASYSVLFNAIELPGAFLQPPYFDETADPAVNFGAIGAIVGHEMGHGFDDQGIIYDSQGRIRDWWSRTALAEFHRRAQGLVEQYDAFSPYPDLHVNGKNTLGENIADLSGLLLAYRAYHLYLADHPGKQGVSRDGLTGDQRFFVAWAQAWRYKAPESAIRHVIKYGFHAPTQYRVNGVVRNIDEWYAAFDVRPGNKLYLPPERRVRIW
jgi:putative endopeptidase